jgi:hypothetical protein
MSIDVSKLTEEQIPGLRAMLCKRPAAPDGDLP